MEVSLERRIYVRDQRTASFKVLPALNDGTFIAGMEIFCVGLRGLTPMRAARFETRNVPKPVTVTEFPFFNSRVIMLVRASSERAAARFVIPAAFAMCEIKSCLDIE